MKNKLTIFLLLQLFIFNSFATEIVISLTNENQLDVTPTTNEKIIYIIESDIIITKNHNINKSVSLQFKYPFKLRFNTPSPVEVKINGKIISSKYRIFDNNNNSIVIGSSLIEKVYPEWFGAKTDDDISDKDAIQQAINFTSDNGTVEFDNSGKYSLKDINSSPVQIKIEKPLNIEGKNANLEISHRAFRIENTDNVTIKNLLIKCIAPSLNEGDTHKDHTGNILLINAQYCNIENVTIENGFGSGQSILLKESSHNLIRNCIIKNTKGYGILLNGDQKFCSNNTLKDNLIVKTGRHGIYSRNHKNFVSTNNQFIDNRLEDIGELSNEKDAVGIEIWNSKNDIIRGNSLKGIGNEKSHIGITIGGKSSSIIVSENIIDSFHTFGIEVGTASKTVLVSNNIIKNIKRDSVQFTSSGIGMVITGLGKSENVNFSNNHVENVDVGISVQQNSTLTIKGNTLLGSDNSLDDPYHRGIYFQKNGKIDSVKTAPINPEAVISDNIIHNFYLGIQLNYDKKYNKLAFCRVVNNTIDNCNWGVIMSNANVTISNNTFENTGGNRSASISMENATIWTISNNIFKQNKFIGFYPGIVTKGVVSANGYLTNNHFINFLVTTSNLNNWSPLETENKSNNEVNSINY
ncbi:right-handed parallel beta-helix repeat-containing protein [Aquimarina algiphila]|nr:right-handed parallel beta-helix repeat-containing protein [Aquimarina algiphila]